MHFYTRLLIGMVLLLNIGLLVSIRMTMKYAKLSSQNDVDREAGVRLSPAKRALTILFVLVIGMNAGAVYANQRIMHVTRELAADLPQQADAGLALNLAK